MRPGQKAPDNVEQEIMTKIGQPSFNEAGAKSPG